MIIDVKTILHEPRHLDLTFGPKWWVGQGEDDPVLGLDTPLRVQISVYREEGRVVMEGRMSAGLLLRCDRCLSAYGREVDSGFSIILSPSPSQPDQTEFELAEEDMSLDFIIEDEIDVDDVVREQVYLSLPMKSLCRENCRGLCSQCGADLNRQQCGCERKSGHPAFTKLKDLKFK